MSTIQSTEERMLIKLANDINKTVNKIFGANCKVDLLIEGAPVSKVALMQECNKAVHAGNDRAKIQVSDTAKVRVSNTQYLPF